MVTPDDLFNININIYPIVKGILVAFLFFYLILSLMVIKQISMMTQTVKSSGNTFLFILAYIHFGVVLATLIASMFLL